GTWHPPPRPKSEKRSIMQIAVRGSAGAVRKGAPGAGFAVAGRRDPAFRSPTGGEDSLAVGNIPRSAGSHGRTANQRLSRRPAGARERARPPAEPRREPPGPSRPPRNDPAPEGPRGGPPLRVRLLDRPDASRSPAPGPPDLPASALHERTLGRGGSRPQPRACPPDPLELSHVRP